MDSSDYPPPDTVLREPRCGLAILINARGKIAIVEFGNPDPGYNGAVEMDLDEIPGVIRKLREVAAELRKIMEK